MKINISSYLLLPLILLFPQFINAQEGATGFTNGITIAIRTEIIPLNATDLQSPQISSADTSSVTAEGKDVIHRVMKDIKNRLYYGYDLEVTNSSEKGKFKVAVKPLSIKPERLIKLNNLQPATIPKYLDEVIINEGDTIALDILENPQTKAKVTDFIKVVSKFREGGSYFPERLPAKDFTLDDVELNFRKAEAFINDQKVTQVGGVSGSNILFYQKDKGLFVISLFPRSGFNLQKIGIIEDNKLTFSFGGDTYKFTSSSPIVGTGGKWNAWVMLTTAVPSFFRESYQFASSGSLEALLKSKPQ